MLCRFHAASSISPFHAHMRSSFFLMCFPMSFAISNESTMGFPNKFCNLGSHKICRLLDGFCRSLPLMYAQSCFTICGRESSALPQISAICAESTKGRLNGLFGFGSRFTLLVVFFSFFDRLVRTVSSSSEASSASMSSSPYPLGVAAAEDGAGEEAAVAAAAANKDAAPSSRLRFLAET